MRLRKKAAEAAAPPPPLTLLKASFGDPSGYMARLGEWVRILHDEDGPRYKTQGVATPAVAYALPSHLAVDDNGKDAAPGLYYKWIGENQVAAFEIVTHTPLEWVPEELKSGQLLRLQFTRRLKESDRANYWPAPLG